MPCRQTAATTLLNSGYELALNESRELVKTCQYVAVSTDGSTGAKDQSYWTITLHGINRNGALVSSILACLPVYHRHSAENISQALRPFFEKAGLSMDKLSSFVTDEGGSAPCIYEHFHCESIHCTAHLLQTVIKRALKTVTATDPVLAVIIDCSKRTISLFRGSTERRKQLNSLQRQHDAPIVSLTKDVETRFNTTYFALKSVLDNKIPILNWINNHEAEASDAQVRLLDANKTAYWAILKDLVSALEPFEQATRKLSQDQVPTLQLIIPEFFALKSKLVRLAQTSIHSSCQHFIEALQCELDTKFLPWKPFELMAFVLTPDFHRLDLKELLYEGLQNVNDCLQDMDSEATPQPASSRASPTASVVDEYASLINRPMDVDVDSAPQNRCQVDSP